MTRDEALQLVNDWTSNKNLVKHMLAVEAQMRAICTYLKAEDKLPSAAEFDPNEWGLAGLIHDADYDKWPEEHPKKLLAHLTQIEAPFWLRSAVETHAWGFNGMSKEPGTSMEWALYTCDELSGFIIACALVRPDKKLATLTVDSIMKKWPQKAFAAGVHRPQVELCEEKLEISLPDYIQICLTALQGISGELGL